MADLVSDGMIRVDWVPTIANLSAPTATELDAGTRLDQVMTPDGLSIEASTAEVDNSSLSSTFDTRMAGRRAHSISVTIKKQDGTTDTVFTTLTYRATGNLVVRRNLPAGDAYAAAQPLEVYPAQCGERSQAFGPNTVQRYTVPMFQTADPVTDAVVAGP